MNFKTLSALAAAGSILSLGAADLSGVLNHNRWDIAECKASTVTVAGKPALLVDFPVDYKNGQKDYLIGWPRLYTKSLTAAEGNWKDAKKLEITVHSEFTGKTPKQRVDFQIFCKGVRNSKVFAFDLTNAQKDRTLTIDLSKLPNKEITKLGINISESSYKHGEDLKLTVISYKLVK